MQAAEADEQDHLGGAANAGAKDDATVKLRKAGITSAISIFMKSSEMDVGLGWHVGLDVTRKARNS
jgi:hypothetical protein